MDGGDISPVKLQFLSRCKLNISRINALLTFLYPRS